MLWVVSLLLQIKLYGLVPPLIKILILALLAPKQLTFIWLEIILEAGGSLIVILKFSLHPTESDTDKV